MDLDPYRLPRAVRPARYDVTLEPDLAAARFAGSVRIDVTVDEPVTEFVLNAAELAVHDVVVDGTPAAFTLDPRLERLTISRPGGHGVGTAVVEIRFDGVLNDRLRGFYRSTYTDDTGVERVIATTQMQSTDCRRAFPCWDEPDFKAVFGITLVVEPNLLAISNSPEVERRSGADGRDVVRFADTMVMSSYLVAFVVGPLEATPAVDVDGVPMRIVHLPGKGHLTAFGMDAAVAGLRFFVDYYGIAYPGDKIDLVALPDFAAGAMENLGCITFRENLLLVDPATSTQAEQQVVVDVITHELAHMWFGDLVTMSWWNGIWLNEAFATFMEVEATDVYRPDWQRWTSFALERSAAFEVDSLSSTRPVEFEVRSPQDAEGMFDVLTYQKGGALLRMLQQYLGPDRFRDGVRHYLRLHSYANTETADLWDALEAVTGEPVRRLMDSWIWQPGFPLVSAAVRDGVLTLRQERFGYAPEVTDDPAEWLVPVHVRQITPEIDSETKILLTGESATLDLVDRDAVVVVNAGGHGFVRVAYDADLLGRLSGPDVARLGTIDRYNLVADAWAAVVAGRLAATEFLAFVQRFGDEGELPPWQAIAAGLRGLDRIVADTDRAAFAAAVRKLVGPALVRLGWTPAPGESQLTGQLRALLVHLMALLGEDGSTRSRCLELFEQAERDGDETVDADLLATATAVVASTGDATRYDSFLANFRDASTPQRALRFLNALADFDDADLIARTCDLAVSDAVKTQNAPFLIGRALAGRRHGAQVWRFVREHWSELNTRFPTNTIHRMVDSVKLQNDEAITADVQAFFSEHDIPQARKQLSQILERQRINARLRAEQAEPFATALR